jgi:hypothetical protein
MATNRDKRLQSDWASEQLEAVCERALIAYHRDERHGGASWLTDRIIDADLTTVAREAFLEADDLPADPEVFQVLDGEEMQLLGEGYHMVVLVEPGHRFVVKYAKQLEPVPPLAAPTEAHREWTHDHGARPDGSLHPAIWQYIRSFEAYGRLTVPSRIYIADSAFQRLSAEEQRALERFRLIGIAGSLGSAPRRLRVKYPDDFPLEKQAPEGVTLSVLVLQPVVTPLAAAIEGSLRAGDAAGARHLEARYREFTEQLWRCGVSHLDFSILNIGIIGSGGAARLQIFDPHIGEIETAGAQTLRDPLVPHAPRERSIDNVLRSSRNGSRWALWRVQQHLTAAEDVPPGAADEAASLVSDFHAASEGVEQGHGAFGRERFDDAWQQYRTHRINTVMHAQLWTLLRHPLGELVRSMLADATPETVYDRRLDVLGMHDDRSLTQFRAGLKVYEHQPLILIANVSEDVSRLVKHWGRMRLPAELDVQNDPAIHYHFRDLFTGEVYVRPGDDLVRSGLLIGLAPHALHVLQVEDVHLAEMAVERSLAVDHDHDFSEFLEHCTKRVGVVGDVHGELQALRELLRALGFIDGFDQWVARDGTLVFTGDVGHGRHLQEVFDFIHRLAAQAHRIGGRIVWTLGNHDLYVDREGGQGGEDSLGYRLWPTIREAALHPERHPGLTVQAAYFEYGKLFVHGGVLPGIVDVVMRERGAADAETVASYVNDVLRRTLVERERITAGDLPHEIFRIGTSHARERRMPGEVGYEPAGVFTPDLRELDHYRYHATLLPQVVGHTASRTGEIRYSPASWLQREYIAIDVGRQHGIGNGGLLLTDFGWVAVTPGGRARLIEVSPLLVRLMRESGSDASSRDHGEENVTRILGTYFRVTKPGRRSRGESQLLFSDLSPAQAVALEHFLATVRQTGQCVLITDLDEMLTAFSGAAREDNSIEVLADYLAAGGVVVFSSTWSFEWFYARLLKPLIQHLGPRSHLLTNVLLILSGGSEIFVQEDGGYRRMSDARRDRAGGFDALVRLSREQRLQGLPDGPERAVYIGNSLMMGGIDHALASRMGIVVDVGDAMIDTPGKPVVDLHRAYQRTIEVIGAATAAMNESGRARIAASPPGPGDTVLWTFQRPQFPAGRRVRVHVGGSGFVHAGVLSPNGAWAPVYNVPLEPLPPGGYEAVLPAGTNVFTFFWTEAPWTPGQPGHWERGRRGVRVFSAR